MNQNPGSPLSVQKVPFRVFVSYAHRDESLKEELEVHLSAMQRQGLIQLWHDRVIESGTEWETEIKTQLEASQIILLLVTPRFMASDYVYSKELIHAMQRHADKTARVIPVILKPVDFEGMSFAGLQALPKNAIPVTRWDDLDEAFLDVAQGIRQVVKSLTADLASEIAPQAEGLGYLSHIVPRLPPKFLPRVAEIKALKAKILNPTKRPVDAMGNRRGVSIQGMGGIGKSVLAAAISRDKEVRKAFPDGIFWVGLGQEPQLIALQTSLAEELGNSAPSFNQIIEGKKWLIKSFSNRACLMVLDDVWEESHLTAFDVLGDHSQLLVTTRDAGLATGIDAVEQSIDLLSVEQSRELLAGWTGYQANDLPIEADEIAKECGYLPLALAIAGTMLRKNHRWSSVLKRLQRADLDKIRQQFPDYEYPNLLKMLQVSVDALRPELKAQYLDFAMFPEDARIPEIVLQVIWAPAGFSDLDTEDAIDELVAKSLLRRDERGQLFLHDLQYDYITQKRENFRTTIEQRILSIYEWATEQNNRNFVELLAHHLRKDLWSNLMGRVKGSNDFSELVQEEIELQIALRKIKKIGQTINNHGLGSEQKRSIINAEINNIKKLLN